MDPDVFYRFVALALEEDLGDGDHSTLSCISATARGKAVLKVKQDAVLAGIEVAQKIFLHKDPSARFKAFVKDGDKVSPGDIAFEVESFAAVILQCERLVLNCMQRMSGIATLTREYVTLLQGCHTRLLDTRKTTPNFRLLEKEAVRIGGALNHRFGLYDMIMLKDNHIDFCGSIATAIERAWQYVQQKKPSLSIEVETRSLQEVMEVVACGQQKVKRIMLDNFSPELLRQALIYIEANTEKGTFETEASGGITKENIRHYADTGVDFISVGALIHQAKSIDLSLKASLFTNTN
ncbi:MAG: carboxylating nicotinate-nucleotide diphosphorylase [Chitinophagia bacterium]|nr:carboxylating nicotinate-nucleotide diphosphorylase [Chitinophagia bacterium]